MTADPLGLAEDVQFATDRLLSTARGLTDPATASLLPGWTQGHVLTHLARNADGLRNLLIWARTNVETPQYASWQAREEGIAAGAGRPIEEQVADLATACAGFAAEVAAMPAQAWTTVVRATTGPEMPAARVMWSRLREVEIHHVDLGAAYTPADWPEAFALRLLRWVARDFAGRPEGPRLVLRPTDMAGEVTVGEGVTGPVVVGPAAAIAGWLIGRTDGAGLSVEGVDTLPSIPEWS